MNPSSLLGGCHVSWADFARGGISSFGLFQLTMAIPGQRTTDHHYIHSQRARSPVTCYGRRVPSPAMDENGGAVVLLAAALTDPTRSIASTVECNTWINTTPTRIRWRLPQCGGATSAVCTPAPWPVYWRYMGGASRPPITMSFTTFMPRHAGTGDPGGRVLHPLTDSGSPSVRHPLNRTPTCKAQWMPSLSVSPSGYPLCRLVRRA